MDKPHLPIAAQRELLRSRGLELLSDAETDRVLHDRSYYRVSGYGRQFQIDPRDGRNDFIPGSSLARIQQLMERDEALRRLLSVALADVELTLRARFAHAAASVHGERAFYLEPGRYLAITRDVDAHINGIERELRRPSLMVARYRRGDDLSQVPIWVAIELVSFGTLARMVQYLDDPLPAKKTADSLSLPWTGFQPTVHALAVLRNACAHHAQLWHRRFSIVAAPAKKDLRSERPYAGDGGSVYATIVALKRYVRAIDRTRGDALGTNLDELFDGDPEYADGITHPSAR
jgi:abortive infection bacteriophage resistance protein